ncbi:MAG: glucuronate isomerase [Eubacteriales bacterium]|nr:glucuronate isomerase [Eubacteriales bacterium]
MQEFSSFDNIPYIADFVQISVQDIIRNRHMEDPLEILLKSPSFRRIISASLSPVEGILPSFERKELLKLILNRLSPLSPQEQTLYYFLEKAFNIHKANSAEDCDLNYNTLCTSLRSSSYGLSGILNTLNLHSIHIMTDIAEDLRPFNRLNSERILKFQAMPQIVLSDYANISSQNFQNAVKRLSAVSGNIGTMADMFTAIESRIDSFYAAGAKSIVIELNETHMPSKNTEKAERAFKTAVDGGKLKNKQAAYYRSTFISHTASACAKRNMLFILVLPNDDKPIYDSINYIIKNLMENSSLPKMVIVASNAAQLETLCNIASGIYDANAMPAFYVRSKYNMDLGFSLRTLALNNMLSFALCQTPMGPSLIDMFSLPIMRKNIANKLQNIKEKHHLPEKTHKSLLEDICFNNLYKLYFE